MEPDNESGWTDGLAEAEFDAPPSVQARAYQIEMFEQSMERNIIVTMDTGSGKTHIAKMRIEAELERSPSKRIWFCAPTVVLAVQQHAYLSSQLKCYNIRLMTGLDNVQHWSTQAIWDAVLQGIELVISTPQVLLDALSHGFISISNFSLLVFDEAHHCSGNSPVAKIMQDFYHPLILSNVGTAPHVLGLTASPVTNSMSNLLKLETNMNAVCRTPTRQIDEYKKHVHVPKLDRITYPTILPDFDPSPKLEQLREVVQRLKIADDPSVRWLSGKSGLSAQVKLDKIYRHGYTMVMKQMRSFFGNMEEIEMTLGRWAASVYAEACISRLNASIQARESVLADLAEEELHYMSQKLASVVETHGTDTTIAPSSADIAPKCQAVIDYLVRNHRPELSAIIFVKRRSVAFTLTKLLQECRQTHNFRVFSFVGTSSTARRSLMDLADMQVQSQAFADFRAGDQNVCVATSVMEEGVDVQAISLVIRFDEPETFRVFVQSRGRARRPDSRLVMVHEVGDSMAKVDTWAALEKAMKEEYIQAKRTLTIRERIEDEDEDEETGSEVYQVQTTGATLSYNNARSHIQHFCTTLPWTESTEPPEAIVIINGVVGKDVAAQIRLPSSVAPSLQVSNSLRTWRSEKSAVKDAAFQCYRKLHMAGVVNDNLLPFPRIESALDKTQTRDSFYQVDEAIDPWQNAITETTSHSDLQIHRIEVFNSGRIFPVLFLLMPIQLDHPLCSILRSTPIGDLTVKITPEQTGLKASTKSAINVSKTLFMMILGRRLKNVDMSQAWPYLIVPDLTPQGMDSWLKRIDVEPVPLAEMTFNSSLQDQAYLIRHVREEIPYLWSPAFSESDVERYAVSDSIIARRLTKQLHFLESNNTTQLPAERTLLVENCFVERVSAAYGELMLFVPSISHMITVALRGQFAVQQGPLRKIGYSNSSLVSTALTASEASSHLNYQRLEFLGDALLKYYASVQVFFEFPLLHESALSSKRQRLVGNARLSESTLKLGLASYLTTARFAGQSWSLFAKTREPGQRSISSKTLADVIESLLGAAFLDSRHTTANQDIVTQALSLFWPEVQWQTPTDHAAEFEIGTNSSTVHVGRLADVESMLRYTFKNKALLAEALTKTSLRGGVPSYQRLEFLGDAILDRIVSTALYQGAVDDPEKMTFVHHALVNHHILAFLAMNISRTATTKDVATTVDGRTSVSEATRIVRLIDHVVIVPDKSQSQQRDRAESSFLATYEEAQRMLSDGHAFPWTLLRSIDTSKVYSDILESIVAAVFIDSGGRLSACEKVLEAFGLMQLLRRLILDSRIEVRPPRELVTRLCPTIQEKTQPLGQFSKDTKRWRCVFTLDNQELAEYVSHVSSDHAMSAAAEIALEVLASKK